MKSNLIVRLLQLRIEVRLLADADIPAGDAAQAERISDDVFDLLAALNERLRQAQHVSGPRGGAPGSLRKKIRRALGYTKP